MHIVDDYIAAAGFCVCDLVCRHSLRSECLRNGKTQIGGEVALVFVAQYFCIRFSAPLDFRFRIQDGIYIEGEPRFVFFFRTQSFRNFCRFVRYRCN